MIIVIGIVLVVGMAMVKIFARVRFIVIGLKIVKAMILVLLATAKVVILDSK